VTGVVTTTYGAVTAMSITTIYTLKSTTINTQC